MTARRRKRAAFQKRLAIANADLLRSKESSPHTGRSLNKGKETTYTGPSNTYWMNDNYAQKNVPAGKDAPNGTVKIKYGKIVKPRIESSQKITTTKKPRQNRYTYGVYVIEIDGDPYDVYVGESMYTPEERLERHQSGVKSAPSLSRAGSLKLRPDLYEDYPRVKTREKSRELERAVAEQLKTYGYKVSGGH